MNRTDFEGRTIVVTGGSSGIGLETAKLIASAGGRLILIGRNPARLDQAVAQLAGAGHAGISFDLTALEETPAHLKGLAAEYGPFDGLVHSAGSHLYAPLGGLSFADFESLWRINVAAGIAAAKGYRQRGVFTGLRSLVLVSSVAGLVGQPGVAAYAATKGALIAATKSLAAELARDRIRVNCVAAGLVRTGMTERMFEMLTPQQIESIEAKHPLGFGQAEDVGAGIAFLLSEASRWITGTTLVIDGGYTAV